MRLSHIVIVVLILDPIFADVRIGIWSNVGVVQRVQV
jgi:hypothetical protein